jgi:RNA-directed DNA polymerase
VVLVPGTREHAEAIRGQVAAVLTPVGLRLSPEKTTVVHIDEGFDFLGFRIQRHPKPGTTRRYVYTFPAKKSLASVKRKVKTITKEGTNQPLSKLLDQLDLVLRGWPRYFQHAVANPFGYLHVVAGCRLDTPEAPKTNWKEPAAQVLPDHRWWPQDAAVALFDPARVPITRCRYRGDIPAPWPKLKATV